jgi:hypothetical protein
VKAYSALPLVAFCLAAACGRSPVRLETRTFALHYLQPGAVEQMLRPYVVDDRPGAKGAITVAAGTVTVRETADNLDRIARVLTQYDRPQPTVRLHFQVIRADGEARADSSIRDVETALRSLFRFRGYSLAADGFVTGSEGTTTRQTLGGTGGPYNLTARINGLSGTGDSAIVHLVVELGFPGPGGSFETSVGIPVGKTAVLGNVTGSTSSTALILTVRPDLIAN